MSSYGLIKPEPSQLDLGSYTTPSGTTIVFICRRAAPAVLPGGRVASVRPWSAAPHIVDAAVGHVSLHSYCWGASMRWLKLMQEFVGDGDVLIASWLRCLGSNSGTRKVGCVHRAGTGHNLNAVPEAIVTARGSGVKKDARDDHCLVGRPTNSPIIIGRKFCSETSARNGRFLAQAEHHCERAPRSPYIPST